MAADIPVGIGIPSHIVDGIKVRYIDDDNITIADEVTTYDEIKATYDIVMEDETPEEIADIQLKDCTLGMTGRNVIAIMKAVNILRRDEGINITTPIASHNMCAADNYVLSKEDMDYDDLCTLESLLSYFKHDKALDMEIAALKKEKRLIDKEKLTKCNDAMMLMQYINPDYVPKDRWSHIMLAATDKPSILLNYIDEDVKISWPVRKIINGNPIMVDHGLRINDTTAADKSGKFQCHSIEVI